MDWSIPSQNIRQRIRRPSDVHAGSESRVDPDCGGPSYNHPTITILSGETRERRSDELPHHRNQAGVQLYPFMWNTVLSTIDSHSCPGFSLQGGGPTGICTAWYSDYRGLHSTAFELQALTGSKIKAESTR